MGFSYPRFDHMGIGTGEDGGEYRRLLRALGNFAVAAQKSKWPPFLASRRVCRQCLGGVAGLAGLLSLIEHLSRSDLGIDQLLARVSAADHAAGVRPGLMSSITAADFVILGVALLLLDWRTRRNGWPAQFLCLTAAVATAFGLFALCLSPGTYPTSMAWPTTVGFFVLRAACSVRDQPGLWEGFSPAAARERGCCEEQFLQLCSS